MARLTPVYVSEHVRFLYSLTNCQKLTFILQKLTFILQKLTFILQKLTFILQKLTFILRKLTFILQKLTYILQKLKRNYSNICFIQTSNKLFCL